MTRINLVEPHQLTDKHLMAEYRELPRIFTAVLKLQGQGKTPADVDIPDHYVLGKGHVKFFYNKLKWLSNRYNNLYQELVSRGFNVNPDIYNAVTVQVEVKLWGSEFWGYWWTPTPEEIYLNMARICKRSNIKHIQEELIDTAFV